MRPRREHLRLSEADQGFSIVKLTRLRSVIRWQQGETLEGFLFDQGMRNGCLDGNVTVVWD